LLFSLATPLPARITVEVGMEIIVDPSVLPNSPVLPLTYTTLFPKPPPWGSPKLFNKAVV
jgi:hypothetical protein